MRRPYAGYIFLIALTLLALFSGAQQRPASASTTFLETFDGSPSTPDAYSPPGWDVAIHSRDSNTWTNLEAMDAMHGSMCEPPMAVHALGGSYPPHVFQCSGHVMTSLNAGGYGVLYLTPPAMVDFSAGEAVIRWDMSTLRTSLRDWIDVWITPYDENLQLPFTTGDVDLHGWPRHAVKVGMGNVNGKTSLSLSRFDNFVNAAIASSCCQNFEAILAAAGLLPDAARRDTIELRLSRTHAKLWMPAYNKVFSDTAIADLGWDQGIVQFGHHSYNPHKECTPSGQLTCQPNTWHWDNVSISPSIPFSITRLSPRQVLNNGTVAFPESALDGDRLRFAAIGLVSLSFDGGATYTAASPQPASTPAGVEKMASYFVPIPAGATGVTVRLATNVWYAGPFQATDFAIWRR